jgi:hypothetical protein
MKQKKTRDGGSKVLDSCWNKNGGQGGNGPIKTVFDMVCQMKKKNLLFVKVRTGTLQATIFVDAYKVTATERMSLLRNKS